MSRGGGGGDRLLPSTICISGVEFGVMGEDRKRGGGQTGEYHCVKAYPLSGRRLDKAGVSSIARYQFYSRVPGVFFTRVSGKTKEKITPGYRIQRKGIMS